MPTDKWKRLLNNRQDAEIAKKGMIIKPISTLAWRTWRLGGSNRFEVIQMSRKTDIEIIGASCISGIGFRVDEN